MKKGFLAIAAAAALVLSSCGDTKKNAEAAAGAADQAAAVETVDTAALSDDTNAAIATLTAQVEQAVKNKEQAAHKSPFASSFVVVLFTIMQKFKLISI